MRRWLRIAARLYPRRWRTRYGAELEALVDDAAPLWTDILDVVRGAVIMQARTFSSYVKLAALVAAGCIVVAMALSLAAPKIYRSASEIRAGSGQPRVDTPDINMRVNRAWQDLTSRASLSEIIQRPTLDLYKSERYREPMEDVIEGMRKDIRLDTEPGGRFRVSFSYPDRQKAQMVADILAQRIVTADNVLGHVIELRRLTANSPAPAPPRPELRIVASASLPEAPIQPERQRFLWWGLGAGLVAGIVASFLRWRTGWTIKVIACGMAGCLAAGVLSMAIADRYTSQSLFRVLAPPGSDGVQRYMSDAQVADWLKSRQKDVLSDASLAEIIQRPTLDLYHKQRESMPLEAMIAAMRTDFNVEARPHSLISITFTYPDRFKAQQVVSALITKFVDASVVTSTADLMAYYPPRRTVRSPLDCAGKVGDAYADCVQTALSDTGAPVAPGPRGTRREVIDLLDPASLPETPVWPNRQIPAGVGLLAGLLLGAFALRRRQSANA